MPKHVAARMVQDYIKGDLKHLNTAFNGNNFKSGESLSDQISNAIFSYSTDLSPALKKMKIEFLTRVGEHCYPDRHISDDFTNEEQIDLCKKDQYKKIFGEYERNLVNYRESDKIRLNHCLEDTGLDPNDKLNCYIKYLDDIKKTNVVLKNGFIATHKSYM